MHESLAIIEFPAFSDPFYAVALFLFGICIGSFLNVIIYRVPRQLSVNNPKRSICPGCKTTIPISRNIPIVTWLIQRGKCKACQCSIPIRYFLVELLNGVLWVACWYYFQTPQEALFFMVLATLSLIIIAIDVELMLIPRVFTGAWLVVALLGGALIPSRLGPFTWQEGLLYAVFGAAIGWVSLWAVVLIGKLIFGTLRFAFEAPVQWHLQEPSNDEEEMSFIIDDEQIYWSDMFFRKSDKLLIDGLTEVTMDGILRTATSLEIRQHYILLDTDRYEIEDLISLKGKTTSAKIPREAMGMGDVDLLAVLGATFGPPSLLIIILFSCLFALFTALLGKVGFSKMLPFGPSLLAGGLFWLLYGEKTWAWYLNLINM